MEKPRKVKDLSNTELCTELEKLEDKLSAEYSILANLKSAKKEIQDEINLRFKQSEED